jgi:hypothetical protein
MAVLTAPLSRGDRTLLFAVEELRCDPRPRDCYLQCRPANPAAQCDQKEATRARARD